jgi:cell fate (sporulation/competence/biofilm development) regulator YlbF (YheA/YmcA/DUF963 family)
MNDETQPYDEDLAQLLSAYLDGQLAPDETDQVERRLTEDPEAQELLDQLRQVSRMVHSLPHDSAPADLADEVMEQMERDALLGVSEGSEELAGRTHLRFRRFAAAAAILILAGAVVTIVYSVLFKQATNNNEPDLHSIEKFAGDKQKSDKNIIEKITNPVFSQVHLVLNSRDPDTDKIRLSNIIDQLKIENEIKRTINDRETIFAFMCSVEQLQAVFVDLKAAKTIQRIDLLIQDENQDSSVVMFNVSESQVLNLSRETDSATRYELALNYQLANLESFPPESYLPNLYILGPNEVIPSLLLEPGSDTTGADQTPEEPKTIETTEQAPKVDDTASQKTEENSLSLVGVQITIRLDDFRLPDTNPAITDPNSLDTSVQSMLESGSEKLYSEPNVINHP